ncbi:MAG: Ig-like domain-containing protein [Thermoplasmatota archaeon]
MRRGTSAALFLFLFFSGIASAMGSLPARDYTLPIAVLPEDFESEFPQMVVIVGGYINGTGEVLDLVWNQTGGPIPSNVTEYETQLNFTPSGPGVYTFTLVVVDEYLNCSLPAVINVTVAPNHPPVILPHEDVMNMTEDDDMEIQLNQFVEDPDEELHYALFATDQSITVNPLGFGSYQLIPDPDFSGEQQISFGITDEFNNTIQLDLTLDIEPVPDPPEFTELNGAEVLVGTQAMEAREDTRAWFNFTWYDPDLLNEGDSIQLGCDNARVMINGSSAWFTSVQDDVGTMVMIFSITDSMGLTDNLSVVLDILEVNDPPVLVVNGMVDQLEAGTNHRINFTGSSDPDDTMLRFYVNIDDGEWIETQGYHVLNFQSEGIYDISFRVMDGKGGSDTLNFTLNVTGAIADDDADDDDVTPPPDDDDNDGGRGIGFDWITLLLAVPILILVIGIALLIVLAFKKQERKSGKEDEEIVDIWGMEEEELFDWGE